MFEKKTIIKNKEGLHARPAAIFINATKKFNSKINITNLETNNAVNAKSIIALLTLSLNNGIEVKINADGEDEEIAVNELIDLIDTGFGEN